MILQSSAKGAIKKLLVVYQEDMAPVIGELCDKLNAHTQLVIWVYNGSFAQLTDFLNGRNISWTEDIESTQSKCIIIRSGEDFSKWVRDPFTVLSANGQTLVIESSNCIKPAKLELVPVQNLIIAEELQKKGIISGIIEPTKWPGLGKCDNWLAIDSGNILTDEDFIFIGGNQFKLVLPILNLAQTPAEERQAIDLIGNLLNQDGLNRQVHVLGYKMNEAEGAPDMAFLPVEGLVHIDLFITLTGVKKNGRYVVLLGQPVDEAGNIIEEEEVNMSKYAQQLEAIRQADGRRKFLVVRNPMPRVNRVSGDRYTFFYNNCLVEVTKKKGGKTVWLPQFAFNAPNDISTDFDRQMRTIWESLGFRVEFIAADLHPFCQRLGALHCLTNELLRV